MQKKHNCYIMERINESRVMFPGLRRTDNPLFLPLSRDLPFFFWLLYDCFFSSDRIFAKLITSIYWSWRTSNELLLPTVLKYRSLQFLILSLKSEFSTNTSLIIIWVLMPPNEFLISLRLFCKLRVVSSDLVYSPLV